MVTFSLGCIKNNNSDVLTTGVSKSGKVTFTGNIQSCAGVIKTVRGQSGINKTDLSDQYLGVRGVVLVDEAVAAQIQEDVANFIIENNGDPRVSIQFSSNFNLPMPAMGNLDNQMTLNVIIQNATYEGVSVYEEVLDEEEVQETLTAAYQYSTEKNRQAKENSFFARMQKMAGNIAHHSGLQASAASADVTVAKKVIKK